MKHLSKSVMTFVLCLMSWGVCAQEEPQKEVVIINPFTHTDAVSDAVSDNVRAAVLSGFSDRNRFYVVDALTDATLSKLYANRNYEDVVNDDNWKSESEAAYKSLGAKSLVIGTANNAAATTKRDDDGDMVYYWTVAFSLKVYNIMDGTMTASEDITVSELSPSSSDAAFASAMKAISIRMKSFVDDHFKFETYILELGEVDKKGNPKEIYISGGTEMGIIKGTLFDVMVNKKIGSKVTKQKIGTLLAKEVLDGVCRCTVKDGAGEIKNVFNEDPKSITIISGQNRKDKTANFFKGLTGIDVRNL